MVGRVKENLQKACVTARANDGFETKYWVWTGNRGTYRDQGTDYEVVMVPENIIIGALEAYVQLRRRIALHVLQSFTCKGQPTIRPGNALANGDTGATIRESGFS